MQDSIKKSLFEKLSSGVCDENIRLTRAELAEYWHMSKRQLEAEANKTYAALPYTIVGNKALYALSDIKHFEQLNRRGAA